MLPLAWRFWIDCFRSLPRNRSYRLRRARPLLEALETRLAPAVFAANDAYTITAGATLTVAGAGTLVAASGFNDAAGIHSDAIVNSPYELGATIYNRGGPEPGWAEGWQVSDGGAFGGHGRALAEANPVYEGDGAVHVLGPGLLGDMWIHRAWSQPQFDRFILEQRVRLPVNGIMGSRPYGFGNNGFGPTWSVRNNRFFAHDGDGRGGDTPEDTGISVTPLAWHKVTLLVDVANQTYEFFIDGQKYNAPDALNFRGSPWSIYNVDYLIDTDVWLDNIRIISLDRTLPRNVLANDTASGDFPLTARQVGPGPASGTLDFRPDGTFTYTPAPGFTGNVTFNYVANDGSTDSNVATVTITVNPVTTPIAVNDRYSIGRDRTLEAGGGPGSVVVQSGFNDALGIFSDPTPGSPYQLGATIHLRGGAEAGWGEGWQVSDGGGGGGAGRALAEGGATFEGDGAAHVLGPGLFGNMWIHRRWTEPQFDRFVLEQRIRFPAHAAMASRPYGPGAGPSAFGPTWSVHNNRFSAHDGDGQGGDTPEDTGISVTPLAWHTITLVVNVVGQTYEFFVDGRKYNAPDPLNFRGSPTSIQNVDYLADSDLWIDHIRMIPLGQSPEGGGTGILSNDQSPTGAALTASLVSGPTRGTLTLGPNGGFRYFPNAGFTGIDTFTYRASDGVSTSNIATVTIEVGLPSISAIPDQQTSRGTPIGPIPFTISDRETPADALTVSALSSNPTLVPVGNIVFGGSGSSRTLTITPVGTLSGMTTITVTVTDTDNGTASTSFVLTVGSNSPPTISDILDQTTSVGTPIGPLAFTVGDAETPVGALTVTGTSSDPTLVPTAGIVLGGSGANRTVSITPAPGQSGSAVITLTVTDGDGATASDSFILTVDVNTLRVTAFAATTTGFRVEFNRVIDRAPINLYGTQTGGQGPADVTLAGSITGPVTGSVVISTDGRSLTFLRTGGILTEDTYTVTLRSAANGFRDTNGNLLDGNGDGAPGDPYANNFTATSVPGVAVGVPDFSRGPGQSVNLPASGTTGIPLRLSNGNGIDSIDLTLRYDPALLTITSATVGSGVPVGAQVIVNTTTPGTLILAFSSPTLLSPGPIDFVRLTAQVPSAAASRYTGKHVLDLTNLLVNEGEVAAADDDGLHVAAYLGDTNANGTYSALDAQRVARVVVNLDSGFAAYPLADPLVIADVTANGQLSATDATRLLQEVVGLDRPEIPSLPGGITIPMPPGPDPLLSLPKHFRAPRGGTVTVPLLLDPYDGLEAADLAISYDTQRLELLSVKRGDLTTDFDLFLVNHDAEAGTIRAGMARNAGPIAGQGSGSVLLLTFRIKPDAPAGQAIINLRQSVGITTTQLNEGGLDLIPDPSNEVGDALDGAITILPHRERASSTADVVPAIDRFFQQYGSELVALVSRNLRANRRA